MLEAASEAIAAETARPEGIGVSPAALDMTNLATFTAAGKQKAPIAQRGKVKHKWVPEGHEPNWHGWHPPF